MRPSRLVFLFCISLLIFLSTETPPSSASPTIKRPYEIIEAAVDGGGPQTVDPAYCYDTQSGELLQNVYDTLVFFDGEHLDRYLHQLATEWSFEEHNPAIHDPDTDLDIHWTYYFRIRTGVRFHDLALPNLTPEDVEYCFEREMVLDMDGGPQWMLYEPLLNGASATFINQTTYDPANSIADRVLVGKMVDHAIESNSTHVWFNLAFEGAYAPFMQILTQPWSSIYSKQWAINLGRPTMWNGAWDVYTGWWTYHNPNIPSLDDPTPAVMGTGPFVLANLNRPDRYWDANRFAQYWRGWPLDWPAYGTSRPAGYINHLEVTWAYSWATRSAMFLNGDVDYCAVPRQRISEVVGQPGIRCVNTLPSLACDALFYNLNINPTTPFGLIYDYGQFGESGIPRDFFGNASWGIHVRKAFSYSINFSEFIQQVYQGEAIQPSTAIIPALPYHDPAVKGYTFNLTRATEEFRQVRQLWDTGFTIHFVYNQGNLARMTLSNLIKSAVESLNPKFHVTVESTLGILYARDHGQLAAFTLGWLADYADPHNFAYPFYHSQGNFAWRTAYNDPVTDSLIDAGIRTPDGPARAQIYHDIQQRIIDTCPNIALDQTSSRHFERDWIVGWYYNAAYSGQYAANTWKWYYVPHALNDTPTQPTSNYLPFDVNYDGVINMRDIGVLATSFGACHGPPIQGTWMFKCDFNNDRKIDLVDIGFTARNFGKTSTIWVPPP